MKNSTIWLIGGIGLVYLFFKGSGLPSQPPNVGVGPSAPATPFSPATTCAVNPASCKSPSTGATGAGNNIPNATRLAPARNMPVTYQVNRGDQYQAPPVNVPIFAQGVAIQQSGDYSIQSQLRS